MQKTASLPREYFEHIYSGASDPWSFATSPYEAEKYASTIALLEQRRFSRALEIGCSIGVLTGMLAVHCDQLLAVDTSSVALAQAHQRTARNGNVHCRQMNIPDEYPEGTFSLIIVSEIGYYWNAADDARARDRIHASLEPEGLLVLVHYLPNVDDYPRSGDEVHTAYMTDQRFAHRRGLRKSLYRADTFSPVPT